MAVTELAFCLETNSGVLPAANFSTNMVLAGGCINKETEGTKPEKRMLFLKADSTTRNVLMLLHQSGFTSGLHFSLVF